MKILDQSIFNSIKHRLPINNIKFLSYPNKNLETSSEYFILKPKGKKCYIWFTYYQKEILCILIYLNDNNILSSQNKFYKLDIVFDNELCYNNTLIQSILINKKNITYIVIDTIFNYNIYNYIISENSYLHNIKSKLKLYDVVIKQIINNNNYKFHIPLIHNNIDELYKKIHNLNYDLYCISAYSTTKFLGNLIFNNQVSFVNTIKANFCIKAEYAMDIYSIYILDNINTIFYDYLLIDSYKLSVFMNNIFRKIKENKNLDLLEESDSEDEFQDTSKNKFVNTEKSIVMQCIYNYKFKKWIPEKVIETHNIINKKELSLLLNKKYNNTYSNLNNSYSKSNNNYSKSNSNYSKYNNNYSKYNNNYSKSNNSHLKFDKHYNNKQ